MKTNEHPLIIPPAIQNLYGVTSSEKLLLSLYVSDPAALNCRALSVLGVSRSGLKKIKRRLLAKGLLRFTASGYQVDVPGLAPVPEGGGTLLPKINSIEKEEKVAPTTMSLRRVASANEILDSYIGTWELALREGAHVSTLHYIVQSTLDSIMDLPDERERNLMLAAFTKRRDAFFALCYSSEHLPRQYQRQVDRLIAKSTPEQLAALRTAIQQAELNGVKPVLLLERLSSEG